MKQILSKQYVMNKERKFNMTERAKDNLKDYLAPYSKEEIQKIRENKMQLVTVPEFQSVHRSLLEEQGKLNKATEALKKACDEIKSLNGSDTILEEFEQILVEIGKEQPKLSIPKWVANIFDKFLEGDYDWYDFEMAFIGCDNEELESNFFAWTNTENAKELTLAYFNPLTRIFVEIEG